MRGYLSDFFNRMSGVESGLSSLTGKVQNLEVGRTFMFKFIEKMNTIFILDPDNSSVNILVFREIHFGYF